MRLFRQISLKNRLSLSVGVVIILVTAVLLLLGRHLYDQRDQDFQNAYLNGLSDLWEAIGENERAAMATNFKSLTRNRKLNTALFRGKTDAIKDAIGPTATRLLALGIADNLMVVTREGRVGFSELPRANAVSETAKQALDTGKQARGFELSPDGRLVNLVAFPILDRADLVGVGVFEKELNSVAQKIKEANGHEVFIMDKSGQLHASTTEQLPELGSVQTETAIYREIPQDELVLGIASLPLKDSAGNTVAILHTREDVTQVVAVRNRLLLIAMAVTIAMLLLSVVGISLYMKHALRPLDDGAGHMERIAAGDLTGEIQCERQDEFGRLMDAMRTMNDDLRRLVGQIVNSTDDVVSTVGQVESASEQTDQQVTRQRAELEQLATALNEMTATANEVAENIARLATSADQSLAATAEGNQLVQESVQGIETLTGHIRHGGETVRDLEKKSERIGVVVEVIKNIAEQTNLLALNAAIEAARAGEQGRGFAVVADEVRTLAARTQDSTTEIEEIIGAVQSGVGQAVNVMDQSVEQAVRVSDQASTINQSLESIHAQVSTISSLSTQVATAAEQQRATTEDMNRNVHTISGMADATAVHSQASAESVSRLMQLSETLKQEMGRFKLA